METYKVCDFAEAGIDCAFVQDNQSASTKGVRRGLHLQKVHPRVKLVRVALGTVFDVAALEGAPILTRARYCFRPKIPIDPF